MKLSELIDHLAPEDEGGNQTYRNAVEFPDGTTLPTRDSEWDGYSIEGELGEWPDGLHMVRELIKRGTLYDFETQANLVIENEDI